MTASIRVSTGPAGPSQRRAAATPPPPPALVGPMIGRLGSYVTPIAPHELALRCRRCIFTARSSEDGVSHRLLREHWAARHATALAEMDPPAPRPSAPAPALRHTSPAPRVKKPASTPQIGPRSAPVVCAMDDCEVSFTRAAMTQRFCCPAHRPVKVQRVDRDAVTVCSGPGCTAEVRQHMATGGRPRRFCSTACKRAEYRAAQPPRQARTTRADSRPRVVCDELMVAGPRAGEACGADCSTDQTSCPSHVYRAKAEAARASQPLPTCALEGCSEPARDRLSAYCSVRHRASAKQDRHNAAHGRVRETRPSVCEGPQCSTPITQASVGRARHYCSTACNSAARRAKAAS